MVVAALALIPDSEPIIPVIEVTYSYLLNYTIEHQLGLYVSTIFSSPLVTNNFSQSCYWLLLS